ncbi:hypothetical protein [Methylobacterium isbiliense]|jgi:hypothetical protein|uniref:Uncharacterized protein n=1 Tax=Methylobacterium isbiliense TaxID=315478 RepID=A0ABQ4SDK6_9HYPH|nr:hypothetical protein [Methylobacterium isbiliense]MDN3623768.1 hypothetical protein [Methylobacterium isbiliense]GJE01169.1 hypothetical protein GMJLKIPL_3098 [Methylobacterium isbiliense]
MAGEKPHGDKTHAQTIRIIEHKDGPNVPAGGGAKIRSSADPRRPSSTHQESRDHNTHNHPGQDGHGPQRHGPAEEKS